MIFDRSLADAQCRSDVLAGQAGKNKAQDLPLAGRKARDLIFSYFLQRAKAADRIVICLIFGIMIGEKMRIHIESAKPNNRMAYEYCTSRREL